MDCSGPPPSELLTAIAQFNRRDYFAAHETLEALWHTAHGETRLFLHGLIQVAVGLKHFQRGNRKGTEALLTRGLEKLERCSPSCMGVDVSGLALDAGRFLQALRSGEAPALPRIRPAPGTQ